MLFPIALDAMQVHSASLLLFFCAKGESEVTSGKIYLSLGHFGQL